MTKRECYDVIPRYLGRALAPKCHHIKKQNKPEQNTKKPWPNKSRKFLPSTFMTFFRLLV